MNPLLVALDARCIGGRLTGDTTYWTGLVEGLASLESEIHYLLYSNAPKPVGIPENPRFSWIHLPSGKDRWWSLFRFPLAARRQGARVLHTQYNLSPLVAKGGITTIHDVSFYHQADWFQPRDRLFLQRFVPPSARRADRVITVSEFSKREIEKYVSGLDGKVHVTPNAVSSQVQPVSDPSETLQKLNLTAPFLLTVGSRWPRKNMQLAIDAAAQAGLPLVVVGKPGWGEERMGSAIATGFLEQPELNALYSAASLYLAPALYEGFGITLLEAFRCGCPVLASPNGAHEEVAGGAAMIAPDFEPATWAARVRDLLADSGKLEQLRQAGRAREQAFTWPHSARLTEAIYREVAG